MSEKLGLQVKVEGDLPQEVLDRIGAAVQNAVRDEVAKIDLLDGYSEDPAALKNLGHGKTGTLGLVYIPPDSPPTPQPENAS